MCTVPFDLQVRGRDGAVAAGALTGARSRPRTAPGGTPTPPVTSWVACCSAPPLPHRGSGVIWIRTCVTSEVSGRINEIIHFLPPHRGTIRVAAFNPKNVQRASSMPDTVRPVPAQGELIRGVGCRVWGVGGDTKEHKQRRRLQVAVTAWNQPSSQTESPVVVTCKRVAWNAST